MHTIIQCNCNTDGNKEQHKLSTSKWNKWLFYTWHSQKSKNLVIQLPVHSYTRSSFTDFAAELLCTRIQNNNVHCEWVY